MTNKIVLVLTEGDLVTILGCLDQVESESNNTFLCEETREVMNKLNSAKDKSFNFLYELAEMEKLLVLGQKHMIFNYLTFVNQLLDLIKNFIQGE